MASPELRALVMRLIAAGSWHEAESAAIQDTSDDSSVSVLLGLAIAAMGEDARAAPILVKAAAARLDAEHPCVDLANLKPPLPRSLVVRQFRACLRAAPSDHRLRLAFAEFLIDIGDAAEAERTLTDAPDSAASHHLLGLAQAEQAKFAACIDSFQHAVALDPAAAASWSNLGMVLKVEGRFTEAIAAHDKAVTLAPANPRFRVNRAVALLKAGQWERAWLDYEARFELPGAPAIDPQRLMPSLAQGDRLTGKTILALHEDGFGDTLQFLRYLPLLADRGARVIARVPPALYRVMRAVPGVTDVVTDTRHRPAHDFVCPMFSLPRVFATTPRTIPAMPPLTLDPALLRQWAGRLPYGGLRVGLVWAGQARPSLPGFGTLDRRRSAGLAAFGPILDVQGVTFVSLQAGPAARHPRPRGLEMFDPMPDVKDFADTAAIIAGLDVVVSVDTSVVHLAGLVGKPVLLLDRYDGCWRWLSGRLDSPWYPAMTILRQEQPDDWTSPMTEAAASLRAVTMFRGFAPMGASAAATLGGGVRERAFVA
jgi:tetratricopeptide (TPR) repeat protein